MCLSRCKETWRWLIVHCVTCPWCCPIHCSVHTAGWNLTHPQGLMDRACYGVLFFFFFLCLHVTEEWQRQESPVETSLNVYYIGEWEKERVYGLQWQISNPPQYFSIEKPRGLPKLLSCLKQFWFRPPLPAWFMCISGVHGLKDKGRILILKPGIVGSHHPPLLHILLLLWVSLHCSTGLGPEYPFLRRKLFRRHLLYFLCEST